MHDYIIIGGQKLANIGILDANCDARQVLGDGPFAKRGTNDEFHNPINYIEPRRLLPKQSVYKDSHGLSLFKLSNGFIGVINEKLYYRITQNQRSFKKFINNFPLNLKEVYECGFIYGSVEC